MGVRIVIGLIFACILALASVEVVALRPLIGASQREFRLERIGFADIPDPGRQTRLHGIAVTPSGTVWVSDVGAPPRMIALDPAGRRLATFEGTEGRGVTVDGETALVVDPHLALIVRLALPDRRENVKIKEETYSPSGAARVTPGTIAVAATGSGSIYLLDDEGAGDKRLGVTKEGRQQLLEPQYPIVDTKGRLYVSDRKGRVLRWDGSGGAEVFELRGLVPGVLSDPRQIAIDGQGRVWVADEAALRVWILSESGDLVGFWRPDDVEVPQGIAIRGDRVYLTALDGHALYWFKLPE